jgi:Flp pilus assembly protein TadG
MNWLRIGSGPVRGSALVELALVLPFLMLVTFGVIDLGRVYRLQTELKNAARQASVYAQNHPAQAANLGVCADPENIRYAALNEQRSASGNFTVAVFNESTNTAVTGCNVVSVAAGARLQLTVSSPFHVVTPLLSFVTGTDITVRANVHVVAQG